MKKNKYYNLCVKAITGDIAPEEKVRLNRWLEESKENQNYYDEIVATWQQTELHDFPFIFDLDQEWSQLKQQLRLESEPARTKLSQHRFGEILDKYAEIFRPRLRPAFVTCLALLIFFAFFFIFKNQSMKSEYLEIFTGNKQHIGYVFSDGSHVKLNSGSLIKFIKPFSDSLRRVFLSGEAFFEVVHDKRPFEVVTRLAKTTVLGTEFNVWTRGDQTRIIVKRGRVRLSSLQTESDNVELSNGQMSWIKKNSSPSLPKNVDTDYILGWLEGRLIFEKTPLQEIIAELTRIYDVSIEVKNSELNEQTITATFDNLSIETVLASICLTLGIDYKTEANVYVLQK